MKAEFKMLHNGVPLYTAMSIEWTMDFYEAIANTNVIDMAMADARNLCGISNISAAGAVEFVLFLDDKQSSISIPWNHKELVYALCGKAQSNSYKVEVHKVVSNGGTVFPTIASIVNYGVSPSVFQSCELIFRTPSGSMSRKTTTIDEIWFTLIFMLSEVRVDSLTHGDIPLLSPSGYNIVQSYLTSSMSIPYTTPSSTTYGLLKPLTLSFLVDYLELPKQMNLGMAVTSATYVPNPNTVSTNAPINTINQTQITNPQYVTNIRSTIADYDKFKDLDDGYYCCVYLGYACIAVWKNSELRIAGNFVDDDSSISDIHKLDMPDKEPRAFIQGLADKVNKKDNSEQNSAPSPIVRDDIMNITRDLCK